MKRKVKCIKCGHEWFKRLQRPNKCPKCGVKYWDKPRKKNAPYKGGLLDKRGVIKLIFALCHSDFKRQKSIAKQLDVTQATISNYLSLLWNGGYANGFKLNMDKIFSSFMENLKERHNLSKKRETERIKDIKLHIKNLKSVGFIKEVIEWYIKEVEGNEKRFGKTTHRLLEKQSGEFRQFIKQDIKQYFRHFCFANPEDYGKYTLREVFNSYLREYPSNWNNLLWSRVGYKPIDMRIKPHSELWDLNFICKRIEGNSFHSALLSAVK